MTGPMRGAVVCGLWMLAACGGEDPQLTGDVGTETAGAATAEGGVPDVANESLEVSFQPLASSTVNGSAEVMAAGAQTRIRVTLAGAAGAGIHQGHIHQGTCANLGGVVEPLLPVATDTAGAGTVSTTVSIPMGELLDGEHVILYHQAGSNPGAPVTCAALPHREPNLD